MSHHPPKTLVKSRENLQAISKNKGPNGQPTGLLKYQAMDTVVQSLWHHIKPLIEYGRDTKHIIDLNRYAPSFHGLIMNEGFVTELIEALTAEYPGVNFAYKETEGYDGKVLERIIVMDWS